MQSDHLALQTFLLEQVGGKKKIKTSNRDNLYSAQKTMTKKTTGLQLSSF